MDQFRGAGRSGPCVGDVAQLAGAQARHGDPAAEDCHTKPTVIAALDPAIDPGSIGSQRGGGSFRG